MLPRWILHRTIHEILVLSCCLAVQAWNYTNKADNNKAVLLQITFGIERNEICVEHGELVNINCRLSVHNMNVSQSTWSLSWHNGDKSLRSREFGKATRNSSTLTVTSDLGVHANWTSDVQRTFTCVGARSSKTSDLHSYKSSLNASVIIRIKPRPVNVIRLRFTETSRGKIIEAFWKPLNIASVVYVLKFCIEDDEDVSPGCPNYRSARWKPECRFRDQTTDYYNVPAQGPICRASFSYGYTALTDLEHRVYVESQRLGCETKGAVRKFYLDYSPDEYPYPNTTTLYLDPHSVINLNVSTPKQRIVQISWSNPAFVYKTSRRYILDYNCSTSDTIWSRNTSANQISLQSVDFPSYRAYDLCEFCVKATLYNYGVSEPVCITARLHAEIPSSSPKITCGGRDCETTKYGRERNVTVTWALPPPKDWNGVLETVKLTYKGRGRNRAQVEISESNLTKGATVLKRLSTNSSYVIKMVACNKEGCSKPDNAISIPILASTLTRPTKSDKNIYMSIGIVAGILILIGTVYLMVMKCRNKDPLALPSLVEPNQYVDAEELTEDYSYDVIAENCL